MQFSMLKTCLFPLKAERKILKGSFWAMDIYRWCNSILKPYGWDNLEWCVKLVAFGDRFWVVKKFSPNTSFQKLFYHLNLGKLVQNNSSETTRQKQPAENNWLKN